MITHRARMLAVELQANLTEPEQKGLAIHNAILDLCEELGGNREAAKKLVSPTAQCVYLMCLVLQRVQFEPFKLQPRAQHAGAGDSEPLPLIDAP